MRDTLRATARTAVLIANRPVATRRMVREAQKAPRPVSLELGGKAPRDGWLVTDASAVTRLYLDATATWPFETDALSHVYADNVVEHLSLAGCRAMLAEAQRCLRDDGVIRIVVPDIRRHVEVYLEGPSAVDHPIAARYRSLGLVVEHPVDLVRIPIGEFDHHLGYAHDFQTLEAELRRSGFRDISRCAVGESDRAHLRGLEKRTGEGEAQLIVEGTR